MPTIDQQLRRWQEAGLLDQDTAERILAFERSEAMRSERPGFVEALVYLALAVVGVGFVVLVGTNWEHLGPAVRIAIPAIATVAALSAGWRMLGLEEPELRRGGQTAWLLALALAAATIAIAAEEGGMEPEDNVLLTALLALPVSFALWLRSPGHAQVVGIAGACTLFALAMAAQVQGDDGGAAFGVALAVFGVAGVALAETELMHPRSITRVLSAIGVVLGSLYAGVPNGPLWGEAIAFAAGAGLIGLSIRRGVFLYMGAGVAAIFIGLVTAILRHIHEPTAAALALIVVGLLLLAGIIVLERVRPWTPRTPGTPAGGAAANAA